MSNYISDEYICRVNAFLSANRIQFVDDDSRAGRHYLNTLPWVDPRSLVSAPSVDVEDVLRDALLWKLAGKDKEVSKEGLKSIHSAFMRAKFQVSEDFVVRYLKEVKK